MCGDVFPLGLVLSAAISAAAQTTAPAQPMVVVTPAEERTFACEPIDLLVEVANPHAGADVKVCGFPSLRLEAWSEAACAWRRMPVDQGGSTSWVQPVVVLGPGRSLVREEHVNDLRIVTVPQRIRVQASWPCVVAGDNVVVDSAWVESRIEPHVRNRELLLENGRRDSARRAMLMDFSNARYADPPPATGGRLLPETGLVKMETIAQTISGMDVSPVLLRQARLLDLKTRVSRAYAARSTAAWDGIANELATLAASGWRPYDPTAFRACLLLFDLRHEVGQRIDVRAAVTTAVARMTYLRPWLVSQGRDIDAMMR